MMAHFLPQIYRENRDIRQQRAILLLLPPTLFRSSASLKTLLSSIMQASDGHTSHAFVLESLGADGAAAVSARPSPALSSQ